MSELITAEFLDESSTDSYQKYYIKKPDVDNKLPVNRGCTDNSHSHSHSHAVYLPIIIGILLLDESHFLTRFNTCYCIVMEW